MDEKKFVRLSQILAFFVEFVKTKGVEPVKQPMDKPFPM